MTKRIETIVDYGSHQSKSSWKKGELHCPHCGIKGVIEEQSEGDFYIGPDYACTGCGAIFQLPNYCEPLNKNNDRDVQIITQLRTRISNLESKAKKRKGGIVRGSFNSLLVPGIRQAMYPRKMIFLDYGTQDIIIEDKETEIRTTVHADELLNIPYAELIPYLERKIDLSEALQGIPPKYNRLYDDEYWRIWKQKNKHKEDGG